MKQWCPKIWLALKPEAASLPLNAWDIRFLEEPFVCTSLRLPHMSPSTFQDHHPAIPQAELLSLQDFNPQGRLPTLSLEHWPFQLLSFQWGTQDTWHQHYRSHGSALPHISSFQITSTAIALCAFGCHQPFEDCWASPWTAMGDVPPQFPHGHLSRF